MKSRIDITCDDNESINNYFANYRSNSCRVNEIHFHYPLNFVPTLKPREDNVLPSPICLGPSRTSPNTVNEDFLSLYEDTRSHSDNEEFKKGYLGFKQSSDSASYGYRGNKSASKQKKKFQTNERLIKVENNEESSGKQALISSKFKKNEAENEHNFKINSELRLDSKAKSAVLDSSVAETNYSPRKSILTHMENKRKTSSLSNAGEILMSV